MNKPIEIRAHHIGSAKALALLPEQTIDALISSKYIKNSKHAFVNLLYDYLALFDNPNQEFEIKIGGLDFICESCPKYHNKTCDPLDPKKIVGAAFLSTSEKRLTDLEVTKKYSLKEGQVYTARELRKRARF